jgi:predicted HTH transcriptional regulator
MTVLDEAAAAIAKRLEELDAEQKELERALVALGEGGGGTPARRPPSSGGKRKTRRRRRGGPTRKDQVVAKVKSNPKIRPSEIAKALKISPAQVSNLLSKLKSEKKIKKDGRSKAWVVNG